MPLASASVDTVLLALKLAFLVLLYLFIWRIVRTAARDLRLPQDTVMLAPGAAGGVASRPPQLGRLVVVRSPSLDPDSEVELDSRPLTVGRGSDNDMALAGDEFASARHAQIEPRRDGVWVHDLGSTNGTFVNGTPIDRSRRLAVGDLIKIGDTELRFER